MGDDMVLRQILKPTIDPKIPSIFTKSKAPINEQPYGQHVDNPLYRHPSQVEQAMVAQHSQVNPNAMETQNMPQQSTNPFSTPLVTHNISTNTWRPNVSRNLYETSLQQGKNVNMQKMGNLPPRPPYHTLNQQPNIQPKLHANIPP